MGDAAADMREYVNHAHNDYAELWLEGGLPALLIAAAAVGIVLLALRRELGHRPNEHDADTHYRGLRLGSTFGLLLLHSAADYPLRTQTLATLAALLAAVLLGSVRNPGHPRSLRAG